MQNNTIIDSWVDWFGAMDSGSAIDKAHLESLFTAFDASHPVIDCKAAVTKHKETVFLAKLSLNSGLNLFHHFEETGGTVYDTEKDAGFIIGVSKSLAMTMTPDTASLFEQPTFASQVVPTVTNILKATTSEEVDVLVDSASKYKPRNFIPVPPFLVRSISSAITSSKGNAKVVLLDTIAQILAFDATHLNDAEYTDIACQKCKPLLFWLYLAQKDDTLVKAIQSQACGNVTLVQSFAKGEKECLRGTSNDPSFSALQRPLEMMVASATTTQGMLQTLSQFQVQTSEKTSKSFKKIPSLYQNMLLVASSVGQATPSKLEDGAMEFFSSVNSVHAQLMLNSILENARLQVSVSPALATLLLSGSFLWSNPITPSGLASSVLTTEGILRNDTLQDALALDLATKFEMSASSITKLTKTQVLFPSNVHDMKERFSALQLIATFFFGEVTVLPQSLTALTNWCEDNISLLKTRLLLDSSFLTKFMMCIDDRIYQWLKQCCKASSIVDTDLDLLNLKLVCSDIQTNRFFYMLPKSILQVKKDDDIDDSSSSRDRKRQKQDKQADKEEKDKASPIRNTNLKEALKMRQNESWNTIFKGKSKEGPMLSIGTYGCCKFHSKGVCYDDCAYKGSHKELNTRDAGLYADYVKKLRGE
jgi:hypothetical protein